VEDTVGVMQAAQECRRGEGHGEQAHGALGRGQLNGLRVDVEYLRDAWGVEGRGKGAATDG
jgi:hypothetical protein